MKWIIVSLVIVTVWAMLQDPNSGNIVSDIIWAAWHAAGG